MSRNDLYTQRLIQRALSNDLSLFRWWLMYSGGELRDGVWKSLPDLNPERCEELVRGLNPNQLGDLIWRGMIPHPQDRDDDHPAFSLRVSSLEHYVEISDQVTIVRDPLFEQVLYDLPDAQAIIRLRHGDLEHLEAARYPGDIPSLMAALWVRIAPASFPKQPRTAHQLVRELSAILHTSAPDAVTFARLRELLLPPTEDDEALDQMILTEREVIAAAIDVVRDGQATRRLAQVVAALIEARNA